jgi:Tfp pilus assembly protein PilX
MPKHHPGVEDRRRREGGAALLVTMLLLTAMTLIGFASLNTVMREREVTGFSSRSQTALYGADAALADSLDVLRDALLPASVLAGDCVGAVPSDTLPNGVAYGPDSTAPTNQLCMLAISGEQCGANSPEFQFLYTSWNLRTEGVAPGGATARVQATARRCHAFITQY